MKIALDAQGPLKVLDRLLISLPTACRHTRALLTPRRLLIAATKGVLVEGFFFDSEYTKHSRKSNSMITWGLQHLLHPSQTQYRKLDLGRGQH